MIARPAAKFARPRVHVSLTAKPYERRSVCVLPASHGISGRVSDVPCMGNCGHTKLTRSKVVDAVQRGEMQWADRFHNKAAYTPAAAGTWQKTRSGPVCTMQLKVGAKSRYVTATQRAPELWSREASHLRQDSGPSFKVPRE
jgi:hypothetical protein